jgi:hypothetical protein
MSSTSRRFARRHLRERTRELEIDKESTDRVDMLGRKLIVESVNWRALVGETASTLGMSREDAGDLIDRYFDETGGNGHPQGLMSWLAGAINEAHGDESRKAPQMDVAEHEEGPAEVDATANSRPELTLLIRHPPGWCAHDAVARGAKVTIVMTMPPDGAGVRHFPVHAEMPETATQDDLRAVIGMTLDYLGLTWKVHEKVLDVLRDSDNWGRPEPADELNN